MKPSINEKTMKLALSLASRAYGHTSPNPLVGAILVKKGEIIGRGWHHAAGLPHAEIEALIDAEQKGKSPKGATLYVTLEPCCTHGRTPACTEAIIAAGIKTVVVGATDPNPAHQGKGFRTLRLKGVEVVTGVLADEAAGLNEVFNHWIVNRTPFVIVKAGMTLDGKIATAGGESKWITGEKARLEGMRLRAGMDAVLVGINTVLADDPGLTIRDQQGRMTDFDTPKRRIILDTHARTPLTAQVVADEYRHLTTIVVGVSAPARRVNSLSRQASVLIAPEREGRIDLKWLLRTLGKHELTSLLVEGGGEVNAAFLEGGLAQRVAFFYAPLVLGGRKSRKGVAGEGITPPSLPLKMEQVKYRWLGPDLLMTARVVQTRVRRKG